MIHAKNFVNAYSRLFSKSIRGFAGTSKANKSTPKDLDKYDIVIIGSNLGGILSRQFEQITKHYYKVMVIFDRNVNEQLPIRGIYEQGKASKTEYQINAKLAIDTNTAHSDGVGIEQILPDENAVILRNSRRIEYDHLVVAMGLNEDLEAIKGFEEAWQDLQHPVFTHRDHPLWKSSDPKHQRWIYNFTGGNAYFCIPPIPYRGEVNSLNVLPAAQVWRNYARHGKVSPLSKFTIVNANNTFCQHLDVADRFIKEALSRNAVDIELETKLVEIDKRNFKATFENIHSGEKSIRDYSNLYVIPPTKPHQSLVNAGLVSKESNGLLDVDMFTLRHKKYKNIFGLGEVNNIPTTKGFWNGLYQLHVVRHNLQRSLNGQELNASFDGRTKVPLQLSEDAITFVEHYYDQKPDRFNLVDKEGGSVAKLRYLNWSKKQKKDFLDLYLGKNYGPPYYRFPKSFSDSGKESGESTAEIKKVSEITSSKIEYAPIRKSNKSDQ